MTKRAVIAKIEKQRQDMLKAVEQGAQGHVVVLRPSDHGAVAALTQTNPELSRALLAGAQELVKQILLPVGRRKLASCQCLHCEKTLFMAELGAIAFMIISEWEAVSGICASCAGDQASEQMIPAAAEKMFRALYTNAGVAGTTTVDAAGRVDVVTVAPLMPQSSPSTHARHPSLCHECGAMLTHTSACLDKVGHAPREGDLSLCLHCGGVHILHDDTWVAPTAAEKATFGPDITDRLYNFEEKRRAYREKVPDLDEHLNDAHGHA